MMQADFLPQPLELYDYRCELSHLLASLFLFFFEGLIGVTGAAFEIAHSVLMSCCLNARA